MSHLLEAALSYAARGWRVFPVYEPIESNGERRCSCGNEACEFPAKHPRHKDGLKQATGELGTLQRWWKGWPRASIGIATGVASGLWVLSVTPGLGDKTLADLEEENGALPITLQSTSGRGSRHYWFHNVATLKLPHDALGPGLTILSDGRYTIAPPSEHLVAPYTWVNNSKLAAIPQWIVDVQQLRHRAASEEAHKLVQVITGVSSDDMSEAVALYTHHNMQRKASWLPFPAVAGACPICPGVDCFKVADTPTQWMCVSPMHQDGGQRKGHIHYGDVLDIDAAQRGRSRRQHLETEAYWGRVVTLRARAEANEARRAEFIGEASVSPIKALVEKSRVLTRSFASLVSILSHEDHTRPVLGDRKLEFNTFSNQWTIGRKLVDSRDISDIRLRVELHYQDKDLHGLTFGNEDIEKAMELVAGQRPYHPVREYLHGLKWDGVERLDHVPSEVLGANDTALHRSWFRKWMISAVARIRNPGCKADSMIVLINPRGGEGKSSFLSVLAGPWFADDVLNVHDNRKAPHALQGVWIYEWAEMETLARGETGAANAFITRRVDNYLPPYGHFIVERPRQCIFGGTGNKMEFLKDRGGRRRFLPIICGARIDLDAAARLRDQWWAEAVALYDQGATWWPDASEREANDDVQEAHTEQDPWASVVFDYLDEHIEVVWEDDGNGRKKRVEKTIPDIDETTVRDILEKAIKMPKDRWTPKEEQRVVRILRAAGWEQIRTNKTRFWKRGSAEQN